MLTLVPRPVSTPGVVTTWQRPAGRPAPDRRTAGVSVVLCTYQRPDSVRQFLESLARQSRLPDELIVIDASRNADTEAVVRALPNLPPTSYWRVEDPLRGLTRQRNFGLAQVARDLVGFFDDDVVLGTTCIEELERAHRSAPGIAGVGCFAETWMAPPTLWRLRRALRIVPSLQPGVYTSTGMSIPWRFHAPTTGLVDGDWLPGCAMMLRTDAATALGFDEAMAGYGQGEDLDFSLRLKAHGRVLIAGSAPCQHFHAPAGRPDAFRLGRMEIWNRYRIWRRVHGGRAPWRLRLAFGYAWTLDTLLLLRDAVHPSRAMDGLRRIGGRLSGAADVILERSPV